MQIRFWGVRGSISVSGSSYTHTGGNTSCIEVLHRGERLILDGGTGLRALGEFVGREALSATMLFSHVHWDHIQGVPFFGPAYNPASRLRLLGAPNLKDALHAQMRPPTFPITLEALRAQLEFCSIQPGQAFETDCFRITALDLPHPDGCLAFRIEADNGKSVVYATDIEHGCALDRRVVEFSEGVNLLIHDAQFTAEEYLGKSGMSRKGWGHSTWNQAVETAMAANVERLALFHHDPQRQDEQVAQIEKTAFQSFRGAFAAREGAPFEV